MPLTRIGLDIGGTKTAGGLVQFPGANVLARRVIPTRPHREPHEVLEDTLNLAADLKSEAESLGHVVDGIGAGVAELVDADGAITSSACIPWRGTPLRQRLAEFAPAYVDADVRAAALGEARYGAGRVYHGFVFVTIGTGISYSLVLSGQPYAGARGNALVLASGPTSHVCNHCGQHSTMVLEEFASGPAIARRYAELTDRVSGLTRGAGASAPPASPTSAFVGLVKGEDVTGAAARRRSRRDRGGPKRRHGIRRRARVRRQCPGSCGHRGRRWTWACGRSLLGVVRRIDACAYLG